MLDAVLAILAGFMWSVTIILTRKGLSNSNYFASLIIITLIGNVIFWPLLLILNPRSPLNVYALLLFTLVGFLHSGLARLIYQRGMLRIGVTANASIFATYSLFSTLFAIPLLGEQPTVFLWIGTLAVIGGTAVIQRSLMNEAHSNNVQNVIRGALLPASGAVIVGLSHALRKIGLNVYPDPLTGVAVAFLTALLVYTLMFGLSSKIRSVTPLNVHTVKLFWKAGVCDAIGWLFMFYAIQYGNVSVVTPLLQIQPLFILIFTYVYLKKLETLSRKLVFGTVIIVLGIVLITAFKGN